MTTTKKEIEIKYTHGYYIVDQNMFNGIPSLIDYLQSIGLDLDVIEQYLPLIKAMIHEDKILIKRK
jgi:hypothetical protein